MTYGEYKYYKKLDSESLSGEVRRLLKLPAPPVMMRDDAFKYYCSRCREVFEGLGFKYKDDFEVRFSKVLSQVRKQSHSMLRGEVLKIQNILKEEDGN